MTALAEVLSAKGKQIIGSDVTDPFFTDEILAQRGITCLPGFKKENIPSDVDAIIYSTAYGRTNPEMSTAIKRNIPLISYPEALGTLMKMYQTSIAIAGTHGKTTITALLGWLCERAGKDPTVIIGARSNNWKANARVGKSELFIFEADEYQDKFSFYQPNYIILNNIDYDHPDFFKDIAAYRNVFKKFICQPLSGGVIFANYDNLEVRHIVQQSEHPIVWCGEDEPSEWQLINRKVMTDGSQVIKVALGGIIFGEFNIKLIGRHNALNCLPVIALAHKLLVPSEDIKDALASFRGTVRRLEIIGRPHDVLIIDDYAHHPTEIEASLKALTESYPARRLICVFQPHTYSRTKALMEDFAGAWRSVDELVLLDIFGSAREAQGTISINDLAKLVTKYNKNVVTLPGPKEAVQYLKNKLQPGDLLVTMGAGETWMVAEDLHKILSGKKPN